MKNKTRSELRDIIVTALYQMEIYDSEKIEYKYIDVIRELIDIESDFVNDTVKGIIDNIKGIDELANKFLTDWTIDRLGKLDRSIIRLGIYELKFTDTPPVVIINESVELAKKYSDDKVVGVINSVMDKIYHEGE